MSKYLTTSLILHPSSTALSTTFKDSVVQFPLRFSFCFRPCRLAGTREGPKSAGDDDLNGTGWGLRTRAGGALTASKVGSSLTYMQTTSSPCNCECRLGWSEPALVRGRLKPHGMMSAAWECAVTAPVDVHADVGALDQPMLVARGSSLRPAPTLASMLPYRSRSPLHPPPVSSSSVILDIGNSDVDGAWERITVGMYSYVAIGTSIRVSGTPLNPANMLWWGCWNNCRGPTALNP
jgi:hypothetical protein